MHEVAPSDVAYIEYILPPEAARKYLNLVTRLSPLDDLVSGHDTSQIERIIRSSRDRTPEPIDYNTHWRAFNQSFFFTNLFKAFVLLHHLKETGEFAVLRQQEVNDIGCGAGPFALAWVHVFDDFRGKVVLVDSSETQLALARRIASVCGVQNFAFLHGSFPEIADKLNGIRLYSYWFCEQYDLMSLLRPHKGAVFVGPGAVVVDYPRVLDALEGALSVTYYVRKWAFAVRDVPGVVRAENNGAKHIHGAFFRPG